MPASSDLLVFTVHKKLPPHPLLRVRASRHPACPPIFCCLWSLSVLGSLLRSLQLFLACAFIAAEVLRCTVEHLASSLGRTVVARPPRDRRLEYSKGSISKERRRCRCIASRGILEGTNLCTFGKGATLACFGVNGHQLRRHVLDSCRC